MAFFKVEHKKGKKWKVVHVRDFPNITSALKATASYFQEFEIPLDDTRVRTATPQEAKTHGGDGQPC